jgi:hypothetical protein
MTPLFRTGLLGGAAGVSLWCLILIFPLSEAIIECINGVSMMLMHTKPPFLLTIGIAWFLYFIPTCLLMVFVEIRKRTRQAPQHNP